MTLDGYAGLAALLAPYAVLLSMIVVAVAGARRRRRPDGQAAATGRYGAPVDGHDRRTGVGPAADPVVSHAAGRGVAAGQPQRPAPPPPTPVASRVAPKVVLPTLEAVLADVGRAETSGDERRLAELSVTAAEVHLAAGRSEPAGEALRRAIRIAVRLDLKGVHARARIELGDMARGAGDLTTACEHWQIARGLFHDTGEDARLEETEARMRANGCPTDWVLNDF